MAKAKYFIVYDIPGAECGKIVEQKELDLEYFASYGQGFVLTDIGAFANAIEHDDLDQTMTFDHLVKCINEDGWAWILGEESDITIIKA